jgi:hypothetical protein
MAADIVLYTEADAELRDLFARERNGDEKDTFERKLRALPENVRWRDNYNPQCRLWSLGLSYWRDFAPLLDERMVLTPEQCLQAVGLICPPGRFPFVGMPPSYDKVTEAGGPGTELEYVMATFGPESRPEPYLPDVLAWLAFDAGSLSGLLTMGWRTEGVLCSL